MKKDPANGIKKAAKIAAEDASIAVFLAMLGVLGWLVTNGLYTSFLHPRFLPFLIGGMVIIAGFVFSLAFGKKLHTTYSRKQIMAQSLVMMLPLLFIVSVAGKGMGTHALALKTTRRSPNALFSTVDGSQILSEAAGSGDERTLLEIARKMKELNGRRVQTEGFSYRDANVPQNYLMLFRFAIFCCAADATPVWVLVEKGEMEAVENQSWVRVSGILEISKIQGNEVPVIKADRIAEMEPPAPGAQYLFF